MLRWPNVKDQLLRRALSVFNHSVSNPDCLSALVMQPAGSHGIRIAEQNPGKCETGYIWHSWTLWRPGHSPHWVVEKAQSRSVLWFACVLEIVWKRKENVHVPNWMFLGDWRSACVCCQIWQFLWQFLTDKTSTELLTQTSPGQWTHQEWINGAREPADEGARVLPVPAATVCASMRAFVWRVGVSRQNC